MDDNTVNNKIYRRIRKKVQNRLRDIRMVEYRMEQTDFAAFLGITYSQYNQYEKAGRPPTLENALEISYKLGKNVNDIWTTREEYGTTKKVE